MPVFQSQLRKLDYSRPETALKHMADHIRSIQEQLEYTLTNLDSSNITQIETDKTVITSSGGSVALTGDRISLSGKKGEKFTAGLKNSVFEFTVTGRQGQQAMYLNSSGQLVITKHTDLSIDGGEW